MATDAEFEDEAVVYEVGTMDPSDADDELGQAERPEFEDLDQAIEAARTYHEMMLTRFPGKKLITIISDAEASEGIAFWAKYEGREYRDDEPEMAGLLDDLGLL